MARNLRNAFSKQQSQEIEWNWLKFPRIENMSNNNAPETVFL